MPSRHNSRASSVKRVSAIYSVASASSLSSSSVVRKGRKRPSNVSIGSATVDSIMSPDPSTSQRAVGAGDFLLAGFDDQQRYSTSTQSVPHSSPSGRHAKGSASSGGKTASESLRQSHVGSAWSLPSQLECNLSHGNTLSETIPIEDTQLNITVQTAKTGTPPGNMGSDYDTSDGGEDEACLSAGESACVSPQLRPRVPQMPPPTTVARSTPRASRLALPSARTATSQESDDAVRTEGVASTVPAMCHTWRGCTFRDDEEEELDLDEEAHEDEVRQRRARSRSSTSSESVTLQNVHIPLSPAEPRDDDVSTTDTANTAAESTMAPHTDDVLSVFGDVSSVASHLAPSVSSPLFAMLAAQGNGSALVHIDDCGAAEKVGSFARALEESREAASLRASLSSRRANMNGSTTPTAGPSPSLGASGHSTTTPFSSNLPWANARSSTGLSTAAHTHNNAAPPRPIHLSPLRARVGTTTAAVADRTPRSSGGGAGFDGLSSSSTVPYFTGNVLEPVDMGLAGTTAGTAAGGRGTMVDVAELDALRLQLLRDLRLCKDMVRSQQCELQTLRDIASAGRKPLWEALGAANSLNGSTSTAGGISARSATPPHENRLFMSASTSRRSNPTLPLAGDISPGESAALAPMTSVFATAGLDACLSLAELDAFERRIVQLALNESSAFGAAQPVVTGLYAASVVSSSPLTDSRVPGARLSQLSSHMPPVVDADDDKDVSELPLVLARGITDFGTLELLVSSPGLRPVAMRPVRERWIAFKKVFTVGDDYFAVRSVVERAERQREYERVSNVFASAGAVTGAGGLNTGFSSAWVTDASPLPPTPIQPCAHTRASRRSSPNMNISSTHSSVAASVGGSPIWRGQRAAPPPLQGLTTLVRRVEKMKDKEVVALLLNPQAASTTPRLF